MIEHPAKIFNSASFPCILFSPRLRTPNTGVSSGLARVSQKGDQRNRFSLVSAPFPCVDSHVSDPKSPTNSKYLLRQHNIFLFLPMSVVSGISSVAKIETRVRESSRAC